MTTTQLEEKRPSRQPYLLLALPLGLTTLLQIAALFQEPEAQAVALGYLISGGTALLAWWKRDRLARFGRPGAAGAGRRFILLGSLGAAWVETAFWVAEKLTGAVGVAASPNLLLDLLVTMPWYVAMVAVLWWAQHRFRYHWTTVALLGGLYEIGGDGIVGHLLTGNSLTPGYLAVLFLLYYWVFVVVYAPIVLLPVWAVPLPNRSEVAPRWQRVLGALLPLLPLIPYGLILHVLFRA